MLAVKESGLGKTGKEGQEVHRESKDGDLDQFFKSHQQYLGKTVSQKPAGYTVFSQGRGQVDPILGLSNTSVSLWKIYK